MNLPTFLPKILPAKLITKKSCEFNNVSHYRKPGYANIDSSFDAPFITGKLGLEMQTMIEIG